jgi:adenosylhomocysteinase
MKSVIRDISLADKGRQKIEWVRKNKPILRSLEDDFKKTTPIKGVRVVFSVHLEAKTEYLSKQF